MTIPTASRPPTKPSKDFPLFPHQNGQWAKKVRGKLHYFGKWLDDPEGRTAVQLWADQKDDLLAGRTPRVSRDALTVADLCNHFCTAKERQLQAGDLSPRSFADYLWTCKIIVESFGRNRLVDDLAAADFDQLRARLAKAYGVHRLANTVQIVRSVFKYGYGASLVDKPVRLSPTFKGPGKRRMRLHKQETGPKDFTAQEILRLVDAAAQPLKAMILLGINCGFGNHDCGSLPLRALDLDRGWVTFPRPKTAIERRCPLWPETVAAIREALDQRPQPKADEHKALVFITRWGQPWAKDTPDSPVTKEFRKLLDDLDQATTDGPQIYRKGVGFYALRHTFETIGGGCRDQVAVDHIMGHVDGTMAGQYREWIADDRLQAVVDYVHAWLFAQQATISTPA